MRTDHDMKPEYDFSNGKRGAVIPSTSVAEETKMNIVLEYNGYSGSVERSPEGQCFFGKILFITDLVTYESDTIAGLDAEFMAAVDDYLLTCKVIGKEPQYRKKIEA